MPDDQLSTTQVGTGNGTAEGTTDNQTTLSPEIQQQLTAKEAELERRYQERQAQLERGFEHKMTEYGQEMRQLRDEIRAARPAAVDETWQTIETQSPDLAPILKPFHERSVALDRRLDKIESMLQPVTLSYQQQQAKAQDIAWIQQTYPGQNAEAMYAEWTAMQSDPRRQFDYFIKSKDQLKTAGITASGQAGTPARQTTMLPSGASAEQGMTKEQAQARLDELVNTNKAIAFRESFPEQWSLLRRRASGEEVIVR